MKVFVYLSATLLATCLVTGANGLFTTNQSLSKAELSFLKPTGSISDMFRINNLTPKDVFNLTVDMTKRLKDIPKYSFDVMSGIPNELATLTPNTMNYLVMGSKELAAAPLEETAKFLTAFCNAGVANNAARPRLSPKISEMNYILATKSSNATYALDNPEGLINDPDFNKNLGLTLIITGWNSDVNRGGNDALDTLVNAYRCRGGTNILIIDTARFVDTLYLWSSFNTVEVGNEVAKALILLREHLELKDVHLIGHSLGGQIIGAAGRAYLENTTTLITRCTALDPAGVCFNEGQTLTTISRGDCGFVEVIHSNGGVLGMKESAGDVDFYPNGATPFMPGCLDLVCSHSRSYQYYAETVYPGNENNFQAVRCDSLLSLQNQRCKGKPIAMGINTPFTAKGNYFLETYHNSPYGKNRDLKRHPDEITCNAA